MGYISVLFKKHKKDLPARLQETAVGEFLRYGFMIFLSAWILQGVRISNWREVVIRYAIDAILTLGLILSGVHWLLALVVAHSVNFALNGQLYAMFTHMGATHVSAEKFLRCTSVLRDKLEKHSFIGAAIAYGSLSRGCYKSTSDIDIRLIPAKKGWWRTALYAVGLRTWAFFTAYPLDMYCYDPQVVIKRMRSDELPIMVKERNACMRDWYPERVEWNEFVDLFSEKNIRK